MYVHEYMYMCVCVYIYASSAQVLLLSSASHGLSLGTLARAAHM